VPCRGALLALALIGLTACSSVSSARPSLVGRVVDAETPSFSHPTAITNTLFPVASLAQVVQLGVDGGQPQRVEVTLMPETRVITWNGQAVETVVAQFIGYHGRRVVEVAYDFFAQADDGSVWYFGETVDNYSAGRVANHSGAWLAGVDGPPGMIMPATPAVGDIYHPENAPGVVFEEVIVLASGLTVAGPRGDVAGAIRVEEHLMDGGVETKVWAPGYGEFRAEAVNELATVAIAHPADAVAGSAPEALQALHRTSAQLVDAMAAGGPAAPDRALVAMRAAWGGLRSASPPLLAAQMEAALDGLENAGSAGDDLAIRQAGIDLLQATLDLELRHRAPAAVDLDRMGAWMRQLMLDADAGERGGWVGDAAIASVIWARTVDRVAGGTRGRVQELLNEVGILVGTEDAAAMAGAANDLVRAIELPD
jgi:hypothetical protein